MGPQLNPDVGSVAGLAADPNNADILYAATCSGGVWRTTNATASAPSWTPLTDNQRTLSVGAVPLSPLDSNNRPVTAQTPLNHLVVFAGTGNFSSGGLPVSTFFPGGLPEGVLRSTDGGATWALLGQSTFQGQNIRAIVPTSLTGPNGGQVVLAATDVYTQDPAPGGQAGGVYLSTDGGTTWTRLSGAKLGLPATYGDEFDASLVQDPANPGTFYTTVFGLKTESGVYRGVYSAAANTVNWTLANGSATPIPSSILSGANAADNLKLAVHPGDATHPSTLFLLTDNSGAVNHLFYSTDQAADWQEMDAVPPINYDGRGSDTLAVVADPTSASVVFVTGSSPPTGSLAGVVYRGDFGQPSGSQWTLVVGSGATGTPPGGSGHNPTDPHTDSKVLAFDAGGNLLLGDDGGIYRLVNLDGARATDRYWVSVNGTLQDTELYAVAYDSVHHTVVGGAQDDGMSTQPAPGQAAWNESFYDDVTHVVVDDSGATPQLYGIGINFDLFRGPFSTQANTLTQVKLADKPGDGLQSGLLPTDRSTSILAWSPLALDAADPKRLLLGYNGLYESTDQGDLVSQVALPGKSGTISALAYGGTANGKANPDVAYVDTSGGQVYVRTTAGGGFTAAPALGGPILSLAVDPNDWHTAYAVNTTQLDSVVCRTTDAGQTWTDVTGNLDSLLLQVDSVIVVHPDGGAPRLVVGGLGTATGASQGSVYASNGPIGASTQWELLGAGLPDVNVQQVVYNAADDVLVAGTYGRGAWTLANASQVLVPPTIPPVIPPPAVTPTPGSIGAPVLGKLVGHGKQWQQTVTLTVGGDTAVAGPIFLVLKGLDARIKLLHRTGLTGKKHHKVPYLNVAPDLPPGTTLKVVLQFSSPTKKRPKYQLQVVTGQLPQ
jgi:hypothetical protein